jgi:hypothetical protein
LKNHFILLVGKNIYNVNNLGKKLIGRGDSTQVHGQVKAGMSGGGEKQFWKLSQARYKW